MNDRKLDALLNAAMRVDSPDLWKRIKPRLDCGPNWAEIRWACAIGVLVLAVWASLPSLHGPGEENFESVALKSRMRKEAMAAAIKY